MLLGPEVWMFCLIDAMVVALICCVLLSTSQPLGCLFDRPVLLYDGFQARCPIHVLAFLSMMNLNCSSS